MKRLEPLLMFMAIYAAGLSSRPVLAADSPEVHSDGRVTFRLSFPKADKALVVGDWLKRGEQLEMARGDDGVWTATAGPFPPGIHIYNFEVDGLPIADPVNPQIKLRSARSGSLVYVPGDALWQARDVPHGNVDINFQKSTVLGDTRWMFVYTPPGYERNVDRKYPVLYLLHGSNDTAAGWVMVGAANFILDNLIAEGKAREMIVVMPYGHAVPFGSPREIQATNTARFEEYLLKDVVPLVEAKYRTASGAANRAIVGLSMGGGQSLTIGFQHPHMFAAIGAFSAAVPGDFSRRFGEVLGDAESLNKKLKLLWIGCGRDDSLAQRNEELSKLLNEKGIDHTFRLTDGVHNYEAWRRYLAEMVTLLF